MQIIVHAGAHLPALSIRIFAQRVNLVFDGVRNLIPLHGAPSVRLGLIFAYPVLDITQLILHSLVEFGKMLLLHDRSLGEDRPLQEAERDVSIHFLSQPGFEIGLQ